MANAKSQKFKIYMNSNNIKIVHSIALYINIIFFGID